MKELLLSAAILAVIFGNAIADTLDVCPQGCPYNSVQNAINSAQNGDVIRVAQGTYIGNFTVNKNIVLEGGYSGPPNWQRDISTYQTVLDGDSAGSVIQINLFNSSPVIDGFTIEHGFANLGGGVDIRHSSPTLRHNLIQKNHANQYGGGIYVIDSTSHPIIDANRIRENNSSVNGGGVFIDDYSRPLLINNIISENSSNSNGTGIYIDFYSEPKIINNTIVANNGGPTWAREGIILLLFPSPIIINNIIANQGCGIDGGGGPGTIIDYNDVWNNTDDYCGNITPGPHDISIDPLFCPDYHIDSTSPVIDQGTSENAPPTDIDDQLRPFGNGIDMGVDENYGQNCIVGIEDESQSIGLAPVSFILHQNYPNPFNPATTIQYNLYANTTLKLSIYDISGQLVKILFSGTQTIGTYSIQWDGTDHSGQQVPSGVYFYRLTAATSNSVRSMILLR